jgi:sarcosine oxidase
MSAYDFLVVGLGTVGSATCLELARRGHSVLGLDARHPPHNLGSHHGETRSIRRAYLEGTSYVPMALNSWESWRRLERDNKTTLLISTGNLTIGPPDCPAVLGFLSSAQTYGISYQYLTAADVSKRWPQLSPARNFVAGLEVEAGLLFPELCMYTLTPDGEFSLGALPEHDNVFIAALAGHGFKFAPVLGEILADMLEGNAPAYDVTMFSPSRFI